jgi:hypothetical protein
LRDGPPLHHSADNFAIFWAVYPRRRDKRKAAKAYTAALKRADPDTILQGARRYAEDPNRDDRYTKYAEGWLNGDGWLDEPLPSRNGDAAVGKATQKALDYGRIGAELIKEIHGEQP